MILIIVLLDPLVEDVSLKGLSFFGNKPWTCLFLLYLFHIGGDSCSIIQDQLLQKVKTELLQKDYKTALQSCRRALSTFELDKSLFTIGIVNPKLSCLLRNMSECFLQLEDIESAMIYASESVRYNHTCYEVSFCISNTC